MTTVTGRSRLGIWLIVAYTVIGVCIQEMPIASLMVQSDVRVDNI